MPARLQDGTTGPAPAKTVKESAGKASGEISMLVEPFLSGGVRKSNFPGPSRGIPRVEANFQLEGTGSDSRPWKAA